MNQKFSVRKIAPALVALLLPVVLLAAALLSGMSDTKIPETLTMRTAEFDMGIFRGIDIDIDAAMNFRFSRDIREFFSYHFDPLFIIATLLPVSMVKGFTWFAFFLRFGLASFTMMRLLRKQIDFGSVFPCLFGCLYSLSSPVLFLSSYTAAMDTVILLPLVFDAIIEFFKNNYDLKGGVRFALILGATFLVSGDFALLYVVPFVFCAICFLAACTAPKFSKSLVALICSVPYFVVAVLIGSISIVNVFTKSDIAFKKEALATFDFRITIFDTITRFFDGKPLLTNAQSPVVALSIFILILLLAFFFNGRIPLRIRITLLVILIFYHFSFASRAFYRISVLFKASQIPSEYSANMRFVCLSALLIFAAAVSLKNIHLTDRRFVMSCMAAVIITLILSNSSVLETSPSLFSLYFSALAAIASYILLINVRKIDSRTVAAVVLLGVLINLGFILPISKYEPTLDEDSVLFDENASKTYSDMPYSELDFFNNDQDSYIILRNYVDNQDIEINEINEINSIAVAAGSGPIFIPLYDCRSFFAGGRAPLIDGNVAEEAKGKVESYVNINLTADEMVSDVLLYSSHNGTVLLDVLSGDDVLNEYEFRCPAINVFDNPQLMNFQAKCYVPKGNISNPYDRFDFYSCNKASLEYFNRVVTPYTKSIMIPESSGDGTVLYTVVTGHKYSDAYKVIVNGSKVDTMNIHGKLAFVANHNVNSMVTIKTEISDLVICIFVSLIAVVCSIVVVLYRKSEGDKNANN